MNELTARQVELVGARRVRGEFPDRLAVTDECGRRVSEQHVSSTSQNWWNGAPYPTMAAVATGVTEGWTAESSRTRFRHRAAVPC